MYPYQNENNTNYNSNTVPNVMMDETQTMQGSGIQIQQGGGMANMMDTTATTNNNNAGQPSIYVYAIDNGVPQFEIPDLIMRRNFVRKVLTILVCQYAIMVPAVEIFIISFSEPITLHVYYGLNILSFCLWIVMYIFSDVRRYMPMNMLALILVTLMQVMAECVQATIIGHLALVNIMLILFQLLALILYSKQDRFKFTNINAILLVIFIFIACIGLVLIIDPVAVFFLSGSAAVNVVYFVYDIHLMLNGHHGYNLQPEEYIFAAANLYADVPNLSWRLLRYYIIDPFMKMYRFLISCCSAEVC